MVAQNNTAQKEQEGLNPSALHLQLKLNSFKSRVAKDNFIKKCIIKYGVYL